MSHTEPSTVPAPEVSAPFPLLDLELQLVEDERDAAEWAAAALALLALGLAALLL